jgi:dTDP-4-amino-4,6-dideoxygalactose transaminase
MDAVLTAMAEDHIGPGDHGQNLIQIARERLGCDYCLALRSPVMALRFALGALDLPEGAGVLISALSPRYYGQVIEELGLKPLYCDTAPGTPCLSAATVSAAMSRTDAAPVTPRCIVADHTLGFVPGMAAIAGLGLPVIEDCSRSFGTVLEPPGLGGFGVFGILGLEERDLLTAGGGALLFAMNRRAASVLRSIGVLPEYALPDLNAAMAVIQVKESARNLEKRRNIAAAYIQSALRTRHKRFVQEEAEYNNYAFPLILETGMKDVLAYARKKDIVVENAFENSLAGEAGFESYRELCPEAWSLSLRTALFPLYPRLTAAGIERVARLILTLP